MNEYKSIIVDAIKALKSVEWAGKLDDVCWECCLFCRGVESGPECVKRSISSRTCQRGTRSCIIIHDKAGHLPDCEYVRLLARAEEASA